jgi:hypothetical protein
MVGALRLNHRRRHQAGGQLGRYRHAAAFVAFTLGITYWAAKQTASAHFLCRRRHHRLGERPRDRRRLHVGGLFPGISGLVYTSAIARSTGGLAGRLASSRS